MDHALRVNYDLNIVRRHAEQAHRFDKLQSLVHQGGAVDGNLRTHIPARMLNRFRRGNCLEFFTAPAAERSAGTGQENLVQFSGPAPREALENRRMLGIHRNDFGTGFGSTLHHKLAGTDKRLLIGQRNALFCLNGGQSRLQTDSAGHRGHNAVDAVQRRSFDQALHAASDPNPGIREGNLQLFCRVLVKNRHKLGLEFSRLLLQPVDLPVCGQRRNPDSGIFRNRGGLTPDGPGAAENGNRFHHNTVITPLLSFRVTLRPSRRRNGDRGSGKPRWPCPVQPA